MAEQLYALFAINDPRYQHSGRLRHVSEESLIPLGFAEEDLVEELIAKLRATEDMRLTPCSRIWVFPVPKRGLCVLDGLSLEGYEFVEDNRLTFE